MSLAAGSTVVVDVQKVAAGGWMLARHDGLVVLASGAIPGERARVRVERVGKGVAFAEVVDVLVPSPDRRPVAGDWRCGGHVLGHVAYERQLRLKGEIVADALARIARFPLDAPVAVTGSPEHGYRIRARLRGQGGRVGFLREGTHVVCDAVATGQLGQDTADWISRLTRVLDLNALTALHQIELAESIDGQQRVCHLLLKAGSQPAAFSALLEGLTGLSASDETSLEAVSLGGVPVVRESIGVTAAAGSVDLSRRARSFFQGNRFLVSTLVDRMLEATGEGPVLDLYAGVGLFGLAAAVAGKGPATLVEGDSSSGVDLVENVRRVSTRAEAVCQDVEGFLRGHRTSRWGTVIVDPPRTGLSPEAIAELCRLRVPTVVYVSCDVATFARDARRLIDSEYRLGSLSAMDLFPNTAHVEIIARFSCD